jgi:hypothetical protein
MFTFTPQANKSLSTQINGGNLSPYASQALQMLSLHLPQFLGGSPIAPDALLRPQPGGNSLTSALQSQLGAAPPPIPSGSTLGGGQLPPGLAPASPFSGSPLGALAGSALNPTTPGNDSGTASPGSLTPTGPSQGSGTPPSPNFVVNDAQQRGPGVATTPNLGQDGSGSPAVGQHGQAPTWANYLNANPGATNPNVQPSVVLDRTGAGLGGQPQGPTSNDLPMPTAPGPGAPDLAGLASALSGLLGMVGNQSAVNPGAGPSYSPRFAPGGMQFGG